MAAGQRGASAPRAPPIGVRAMDKRPSLVGMTAAGSINSVAFGESPDTISSLPGVRAKSSKRRMTAGEWQHSLQLARAAFAEVDDLLATEFELPREILLCQLVLENEVIRLNKLSQTMSSPVAVPSRANYLRAVGGIVEGARNDAELSCGKVIRVILKFQWKYRAKLRVFSALGPRVLATKKWSGAYYGDLRTGAIGARVPWMVVPDTSSPSQIVRLIDNHWKLARP